MNFLRNIYIMIIAFFLYFHLSTTVDSQTVDGIQVKLGSQGLISLKYNGIEFLADDQRGAMKPTNNTPQLQSGSDVAMGSSEPVSVAIERDTATIRYTYPWADIYCTYTVKSNKLNLKIYIRNVNSDRTLKKLTLDIVDLAFSQEPSARTLEAGIWGNGAVLRPMSVMPLIIAPDQAPPVVEIRSPNAALVYASDDPPAEKRLQNMGIPFTDKKKKGTYPLWITVKPLAPSEAVTINVSLRFGASSVPLQSLAGDVLKAFAASYPFELNWPSHAPIGALFLATSQPHPPGNPRGWLFNAKDIDLNTPAGLRIWHDRLMVFADESIRVLKDIGAQGMITWDPEGEEFRSATYYGAPQLTTKLAPETDFIDDGNVKTIDEYFEKFRAAGLRTGVAIRPQHIVFNNGIPSQQFSSDPLSELQAKIRYAKERWGCTLFYLDSTYDMAGPLSADIMRSLHEANPDVLLIPEHEDFRDFAYAAPLNSFNHQGVTTTPASIREVYGKSFSVLQASLPQKTPVSSIQRLIQSVGQGDILLVNAWYQGPHTEFLKQIYDAARKPTAR